MCLQSRYALLLNVKRFYGHIEINSAGGFICKGNKIFYIKLAYYVYIKLVFLLPKLDNKRACKGISKIKRGKCQEVIVVICEKLGMIFSRDCFI